MGPDNSVPLATKDNPNPKSKYDKNETGFANDLKSTLDKYVQTVEELCAQQADNAVVFHGVSDNIFAGSFNVKLTVAGKKFNIIQLAEFLYLNEEIRKKPDAKLVFAGAISAANQACETNLDAVKTAFQQLQTNNPTIYNAIENTFQVNTKLNNYKNCNILSNINTAPPQLGLNEANGVGSPEI